METRGYETINDRSAGWGPGVNPASQPDEDAPVQDTESRLENTLKEREYVDYEPSVNGEFVDYDGEIAGDAIERTEDDPIVAGANRPAEKWAFTPGSEAWNDAGFSLPGEVTPVGGSVDMGTVDERGDASVAWGDFHVEEGNE